MALSPGPCEDSSWATAVFRLNLKRVLNLVKIWKGLDERNLTKIRIGLFLLVGLRDNPDHPGPKGSFKTIQSKNNADQLKNKAKEYGSIVAISVPIPAALS